MLRNLSPSEGAKPVGLTFHRQGLPFTLVPSPDCGFVRSPCPGPRAPPDVTHNPALGRQARGLDALSLADASWCPGWGRAWSHRVPACPSRGSLGHKLGRALWKPKPRESPRPRAGPQHRGASLSAGSRLAHGQSRDLFRQTLGRGKARTRDNGLMWESGPTQASGPRVPGSLGTTWRSDLAVVTGSQGC